MMSCCGVALKVIDNDAYSFCYLTLRSVAIRMPIILRKFYPSNYGVHTMHSLLKTYALYAFALLLIGGLLVGCGGKASGSNGPTGGSNNDNGDTTSVVVRADVPGLDVDPPAETPTIVRRGNAPTKLALLVGVNTYLNRSSLSQLQGAVNDVSRMEKLLTTKYEFPEENVLTLVNEAATHEGIVQAFRDHLIANARQGDIVVFHFSGHGSQMRDHEDDEDIEPDGRDETIVPADSRRDGVYDITDDELNALVRELADKDPHITLIFDSCHSGTASRGGGLARQAEVDDRDPPAPASSTTRTRAAAATEDVPTLREAGADYVMLSAARSSQQA